MSGQQWCEKEPIITETMINNLRNNGDISGVDLRATVNKCTSWPYGQNILALSRWLPLWYASQEHTN